MGYVRNGDIENESVSYLFYNDCVVKILCEFTVDCDMLGGSEVKSAFRRDPLGSLRLRIGLFPESSTADYACKQ